MSVSFPDHRPEALAFSILPSSYSAYYYFYLSIEFDLLVNP